MDMKALRITFSSARFRVGSGVSGGGGGNRTRVRMASFGCVYVRSFLIVLAERPAQGARRVVRESGFFLVLPAPTAARTSPLFCRPPTLTGVRSENARCQLSSESEVIVGSYSALPRFDEVATTRHATSDIYHPSRPFAPGIPVPV